MRNCLYNNYIIRNNIIGVNIGLKFICSHCGFELDGEFPWFEMDLPDYMPAYCPKCGMPMKTGSE